MLIIPAIDLKDGCVVRLVQGKRDKKIYSRNPLKTARHWVRQGAKLIHIVDLDGAYSGVPKNLDLAKEIARNIDVPVEFGGGIRSMEMIKKLLDYGISRVVLGTRAVEDGKFLKNAFKKFKQKIIVSLDASADTVLVKGWQKSSKKTSLIAFARRLKDLGFKQLIYTDTLKDGTLSGPNIKAARSLLKEVPLKLIASGGISSLEDIFKLKLLEKQGLIGVIVGKALYEGKFTLTQALKIGGR